MCDFLNLKVTSESFLNLQQGENSASTVSNFQNSRRVFMCSFV